MLPSTPARNRWPSMKASDRSRASSSGVRRPFLPIETVWILPSRAADLFHVLVKPLVRRHHIRIVTEQRFVGRQGRFKRSLSSRRLANT